MSTMSVTMTGHCEFCTWGDRYVIHNTPYCPQIPAIAQVDTNSPWRLGRVNRPVEVGDVVILMECDGLEVLPGGIGDASFITWGVITSFDLDTRIIHAEEIGEPQRGWMFIGPIPKEPS